MKIDRLMGIMVYLLTNGRTSAQELAEKFEVSSRTIMRDIESLNQAGIPIQSFCGVEGGYQIMEGYVLDKQVATNNEYEWIVAALEGMASAYMNKSLEQIMCKMNSLKHRNIRHTFSVDLSVASEDHKINEQLKILEGAIEKRCLVEFEYTNSRDEVKQIQVEPVQLQYKWYHWYLIAYYEKYQDYCMFKLLRMQHLKVMNIESTKIHNLSDIKQIENHDSIVNIKLYAKAVIKSKCREYLNGEITREYENGDFEFCFSVPTHETFWYGMILSFGDKVKIIEPQEIRERILRTCREIQMQYDN